MRDSDNTPLTGPAAHRPSGYATRRQKSRSDGLSSDTPQRHDCGIHAVCAERRHENTQASWIRALRPAHDQVEPPAPHENGMKAASTPYGAVGNPIRGRTGPNQPPEPRFHGVRTHWIPGFRAWRGILAPPARPPKPRKAGYSSASRCRWQLVVHRTVVTAKLSTGGASGRHRDGRIRHGGGTRWRRAAGNARRMK
jgi:hypothetical protein